MNPQAVGRPGTNFTTQSLDGKLDPMSIDFSKVRLTQQDLVDVPDFRSSMHPRPNVFAECLDMESAAAWIDREFHRPTSSAHHRTVLVLGKPYHWRQDYTGQLKLAAGESPW